MTPPSWKGARLKLRPALNDQCQHHGATLSEGGLLGVSEGRGLGLILGGTLFYARVTFKTLLVSKIKVPFKYKLIYHTSKVHTSAPKMQIFPPQNKGIIKYGGKVSPWVWHFTVTYSTFSTQTCPLL